MIKPPIYNVSYLSYINLLSKIEDKLTFYKETLNSLNIVIPHPSNYVSLSLEQLKVIQKTFKKESDKFGTSDNFYSCLLLVNYHVASILLLKSLKTEDIVSVSVSIEDYLIIESFIEL